MALTAVEISSSLAEFALPAAKRPRFDNGGPEIILKQPQGSRIFSPFRTVGLVSSTAVPFASQALGKTTFQITTSVGRNLQTYDLRRGLNLVFVTRPQTPEVITATCAYRDRVFAAWGGLQPDETQGVSVFKRGKLAGVLEPSRGPAQAIKQLLVFGSWIIGCGEVAIEAWKSDTYEHYTTIRPPGRQSGDRILSGRMCNLPTFLNKIFVGRKDGNVEIYNVSTGKLVYTIIPPSSTSGAVTVLQGTPALSLLAIGYADGSLAIHDVETDEQVVQLRQSNASHPITSISFRTDGMGAGEDGRKEGVFATASIESGDVTLWDLTNGGRVVGVLRGAHETSSSAGSGINNIEFLPDQAVLVSSGLDNALRSWVFDQTPFSPIPRPLHSRSGHAAPVTIVSFLPAASDGSESAGKWLLSAGQDRSLWGVSLRKDGQSSEISQGNVKKKAKKTGHLQESSSNVEHVKATPITSIACSLNRDGGMGGASGPVWTNSKGVNNDETNIIGWESIVTAHEGDKFARTWFWGKKKAGRWAFETSDHTVVSCVAITSCGTFALVGSCGGSIDMFNLQSGLHRQRFPPKPKPGQVKKLHKQGLEVDGLTMTDRGHSDAVTGIAVDTLNQFVISCSLDGTVIFWDFTTGMTARKLHLDSASATALRYNATSGLLSLACDDLSIRVLDVETKKTVRELWGCVGQIYDHCFSHDGRWILACSMDSVIRVFDLATGHLIDAFKTITCTSLAFSSTGEFLATTHAGSSGINIWNNKSLFSHVSARQIDDEVGIIDLSSPASFVTNSQLAIDDGPVGGDMILDSENDVSMDQLHSSLVTLSLVPQSRWQTLLNLDIIRQRNKPIEPPQLPKKAPFFLPSTLSHGAITPDQPSTEQNPQPSTITPAERSRISKLQASQQIQQSRTSPFSTLLTTFSLSPTRPPNPTSIINHLTTLSPSATDLEIRFLQLAEMPIFVRALTAQLQRKRDFELVNAWMSCFLRLHGEVVQANPGLRAEVLKWRRAMIAEEQRLGDLVGYCKGVVEFLRSSR